MRDLAGAAIVPAATSPPPRIRIGSRSISRTWLTFLQFAAITFAFRLILFGNPLVHDDEQFYLLVADRWSHGALPFVDIWDRKPVGLFLLYRLFLLVPGDPVRVYQLFGMLATATTAVLVQRLAREIAQPKAAWLAGIVYILVMPAFTCSFGQAPVFYNLLMTYAALHVVSTWKRLDTANLLLHGASVTALVGVALQIKYSVVFEGAAFGLILLARGWADAWGWRRLALAGMVWITAALAPTMVAYACYAAIGHGAEFLQSNFISIFLRLPEGNAAWFRLLTQIFALTPFWLAVLVAPRMMAMPHPSHPAALVVLRIWAGAALVGYLASGTWYDHYAAPMLCPLSILAAPVLARPIRNGGWLGHMLLIASAAGGLTVMVLQLKNHGNADQFARATALVRSEMHGGCFYQFNGEPALYRSVGACIPTRYAFPSHLSTWTETPAIGTDQVREVARIMLTHPDVVVYDEHGDGWLPNYVARDVAKDFLAHDYRRYAYAELGKHRYGLYRLKWH